MQNPIKILQEEHHVLRQAVETTQQVQQIKDDKHYRWLIHDMILFFRNFNELFHYPKEEDVLYPVIKNRAEKINEKLFYEICDNHEDFKSLIAEIEDHFGAHNYRLVRKTMETYLKETLEHIEKEDKEILHISANLLLKNEVEKINDDFKILDGKLGEEEKEKLIKIIQNTNLQLSKESCIKNIK